MSLRDPLVRLNVELPRSLREQFLDTVGWGNARRVTNALIRRFLADYRERGSPALAELLNYRDP